jgi:signal recognition particle subunit SRP54
MMDEVDRVRAAASPHEILLVVDGMTGQDAVQAASAFEERLGLDGFILTKMDGDARGGAALSIRQVTGKPVKLIGTGEGIEALEDFHPERMAQRILGMGDVLTLVEKAEAAVDEEKARDLARKLRERSFTLDDFAEQLRSVRKMGPLDQILGMIPGASRLPKGLDVDEKALSRVEAILSSMTPAERREPVVLNGTRRRRIARGSGTSVQEVNQLLRQYEMLRKMMRRAGKGRRSGIPWGM